MSNFKYETFLPTAKKGLPCKMNSEAYEFSILWMERLGERAKRMQCDERLVIAAQKHAEYLYSRTPDLYYLGMHIGRNGSYPNGRVIDEGYKLPDGYDYNKNNIESCARNFSTAENTLNLLYNSPSHFEHLSGQGWFIDHVVYGIGFYITDWVILIAPQEQ